MGSDMWARDNDLADYFYRNYHSKGLHQVLKKPVPKESNVNHAPNYTALELLKMKAGRFDLADHAGLFRRLAIDKGWDLKDIRLLADLGVLGTMMQTLLLRIPNVPSTVPIYNFLGETLHNYEPAKTVEYDGTHAMNAKIDAAAFMTAQTSGMLRGAATEFDAVELNTLPKEVKALPIAVIGQGAAGIMVVAALRRTGFHNITIFEKSEDNLGIWRQKNVYQRSRNNPRNIKFLGKVLTAAPGPGLEVRDFLTALLAKDGVIRKQRLVNRVSPAGGFDHEIQDLDPAGQKALPNVDANQTKFPIIINCIGLGKPAPISDGLRMRSPSTEQVGPRWQTTLDRAGVHGKKFTFIGLGNSTAEMIRQIHDLQDQPNPPDTDYRILTHYPKDAVFNPDDYVDFNNRTYRVFRDLSKPNLVKYHGDLADFRDDYFRALSGGKIIPDVTEWYRHVGVDNRLEIRVRDRSVKKIKTEVIQDDQQYTLIGYEHPRADIESMGCRYDAENKCALYDYDGEFHAMFSRHPPDRRLYKGYFGFGSVLKAPHNPNAIVIPGMNFRIGDLLFGVIVRAVEAVRTKV